MTFEEIYSGKEKRRKRLSNKKYERTLSDRKHAKHRRLLRAALNEDIYDESGDVLMNGNINREAKNEKKFRETQDAETEEEENGKDE